MHFGKIQTSLILRSVFTTFAIVSASEEVISTLYQTDKYDAINCQYER